MNAPADRGESLPQRLYLLLRDQQFHSGQRLAAECAVSRAAISKAIARLRELGVTVDAVAKRGYRLPRAAAPLEVQNIRAALPKAVLARLRQGDAVWSTGSTNAELLERTDLPPGRFDFLTAEYQSAGRGRRTRSWYAPPGGAICLSMSWSFRSLPTAITALSLAVGVCALRALKRLGVTRAELKWPNDLVAGEAKLGGILTELRVEHERGAFVVIGIGLNVALGAAVLERIKASGTQAIDLAALGLSGIERNAIVAALMAQIVPGLLQFEREGFSAFAQEWRDADALAGREVRVSLEAGSIAGHARGIDLEGALCVQTRDGVQRFLSGDVSVRAVV
jgi:BirA family transcriptional regulator, biotin operon repressor / biotin---[acetyl-CoA-carboxylase] ligase